jgi:hypothetical protein
LEAYVCARSVVILLVLRYDVVVWLNQAAGLILHRVPATVDEDYRVSEDMAKDLGTYSQVVVY